MIYEVKQAKKTYRIDDLKPFNQQSQEFQSAFHEAEKITADGIFMVEFDNATASLFTKSNRVLISLNEIENENI